ncbi:hypothetical protein ABZ319_34045 [Nocardia sp. NPDC005978]|uniref:hypothetical protein n=1 Tax=Nocardia sp. NPDC005978 TaxID=3156725 RepID=UPI0033AF27A7
MNEAVAPANWDEIAADPLDHHYGYARVLAGSLSNRYDERGLLHGLRLASAQLRMPVVSAHFGGSTAPAHVDTWGEFVHGVGEVALWAASSLPTSETDRRLLLNFLGVWAETVFADRDRRLWITAGEPGPAVHADTEHTRIRIGWDRGRGRFVESRRSPDRSPDTDSTALELVWGDRSQLSEFTRLVREHGPLPWNPHAPRVLAASSGLSRAAAAILLSGCTRRRRYEDMVPTDLRKALDIGTADLADALLELRIALGGEFGGSAALFTAALPADPARLWEPDGLCVLAEGMARAWNERYGRRVPVPERTLTAAMAIRSALPSARSARVGSVAENVAMLADPSAEPLLNEVLDARLEHTERGWCITGDSEQLDRFRCRWRLLVDLCRWAYAYLPAGDPVRAGVPHTIDRIRVQLRHPGLLLGLGSVSARTIESLRHRRATGPWPDSGGDAGTFDDGLILAADADRDHQWELYIRPAQYLLDDRTRDARAAVESYNRDTVIALDWVFGSDCDRMVERIGSGVVPAGRYETDPALSAPDLVTEVAAALDLDPDAAALYLQLATLIAPTDRNIREWNGWKPARHRAAETALADRDLVVRDKRGRAGRSVFLPGEWITKPGVEQWKWLLHGLERDWSGKSIHGTATPARTLADLYRAAWDLVRGANAPTVGHTTAIEGHDATNTEPDLADKRTAQPSTTPAEPSHSDVPAGPDATAVAPRPLDDFAGLTRALHGSTPRDAAHPRILRAIEIVSNLLCGGVIPPGTDEWSHVAVFGYWRSAVMSVGAVAARAAVATTSDRDREYLLALLDLWSVTVFADPAVQLRVGRCITDLPVIADAHGVAVAVSESRSGRREFIDLRIGGAEPPMLGPIESVDVVEPGWGDSAQLRDFVAAVRREGPLPWDTGAVDLLARRTGMSPAAAALAMAGYLPWYLTPATDLSPAQLRTLGIGAAAADAARELSGSGSSADRALIAAAMLPADPADLWEPGGVRRAADRLADAWIERFGVRPFVSEPTRAALDAACSDFGTCSWSISAGELCTVLAAPDKTAVSARIDHRFSFTWTVIFDACLWAYSHLPQGDPVREGAGATLNELRTRLRDPALVLHMSSAKEPEIRALSQLTGVAITESATGGRRYDDGLVIATHEGVDKDYWDMRFRPAHYDLTAHSDLLRSIGGGFRDELPYLDRLFDPDCDRVLARLAAADLPPGGFEAYPAHTVPDLVDEVAATHGLSADAAALYLQLLTLKDPTDRNIRRWNGWKPPRHTAARDLLLARGLVIEDRRKKAGRTVFIGSRWVGKPGLELWKLPLHNLTEGWRDRIEGSRVTVPRRALPDLYRAAWDRVRTGDVPR